MKASKIFATVFAAVAMFTTNATQAIADNYHASDVHINVGTGSGTDFSLNLLGTAADGSEIWIGQNHTGNYAYMWTYIDGAAFSSNVSSFDVNETYDLKPEDDVWRINSRLIDKYVALHVVKVKSNTGYGNKYMMINGQKPDNSGWEDFAVTGLKMDVTLDGDPVYDAENDTYTQHINWDMEDNLLLDMGNDTEQSICNTIKVYAYFDDSEDSVLVAQRENGWCCTYTDADVTFPASHSKVRFAIKAITLKCYSVLTPNGCGAWTSEPTETVYLDKASEAKGANDFFDEQTTNGINAIDTDTDANATVDIYNLAGMRVAQGTTLQEASSSLNRGVYVVNGKKVMLGK